MDRGRRGARRRIVLSASALVLLALVVPLAVGLVDLFGGTVVVSVLDAVAKYGGSPGTATMPRVFNAYSNTTVRVSYLHTKTGASTYTVDEQTVSYAAAAGKNYSSLVVSTSQASHSATRNTVLAWQLNVTPTSLKAAGVDRLRAEFNWSASRQLMVKNPTGGSFVSDAATLDLYSGWRCTVGTSHRFGSPKFDIFNRSGAVPYKPYIDVVQFYPDFGVNLTSGGANKVFRAFELKLFQNSLDGTEEYCSGASATSFVLMVADTGNTDATSIAFGDEVQWIFSWLASSVNREKVVEVGIGTLGVTLVLGAAAASPAWQPSRPTR